MSYTTKEFCRICGVGRETLRHYENLGFLHPKTNPDNHYRNYDEWDASIIADIKRYQSLGFSLGEIKQIFLETDLDYLIHSVAEHIHTYRDQIRYFQMLCKKSEEELAILKQIPHLLNQYTASQIPSHVYIPDKDLLSFSFASSPDSAMKHLDFFTPCIRINHRYEGDESKQDYSGWGLITQREYAAYLNIHAGITIPASKIICTIIDAGEKGNISKSLFNSFSSYIEHETGEVNLTIYANLLSRAYDKEGIYHRYLFAFSPISAAL